MFQLIYVQVCSPVEAATDRLAGALAGTPWAVRRARGSGARLALEIYEAGSLADIIVTTPVAAPVLRGARRSRGAGQAFGLAWGRLPAGGQPVTVAFKRGAPRFETAQAEVIEVAGLAWFAVLTGRFAVVSAAYHGGSERLRLRTGSLW